MIVNRKEARDSMREKLRAALQEKGLKSTRVSKDAGLNPAFLNQFLKGRANSKDQNIEKVCKTIGLRWAWLKEDEDPKWEAEAPRPQLSRQSLIHLLEGIFLYLDPEMLESDFRAAAETALEVAESQPNGMSENDKRNRIHSEIRGVLRAILHR